MSLVSSKSKKLKHLRHLKPHKSPRLPAINSAHLEDLKNSENSQNLKNEKISKNPENPENDENPEVTENPDKIPKIVDTKEIQNIKVEPETAKKKRVRRIRINQDGKVLHLRNHKSALSKYTHNKPSFKNGINLSNSSGIQTVLRYKAGISMYSKKKLMKNPYLMPAVENRTTVHKERENIKFPSIKSRTIDKEGKEGKEGKEDFLNKLKANDSISKITPSKKKIDAKARKQLKVGLRKSRKAAPRVSEERKNS